MARSISTITKSCTSECLTILCMHTAALDFKLLARCHGANSTVTPGNYPKENILHTAVAFTVPVWF